MKISNLINKLNNQDKQKLQNTLLQAYPAYDLRVNWSYDTDNKKIYLEINYLVNKTAKLESETDIESIFEKSFKTFNK